MLNKRSNRWGRSVIAGIVACSFGVAQAPLAWAEASPAKPAAAAAPASAANGKTDLVAAKKHYSDGEKKFKAGDYAGALADFKEANEVKSTPHAERYLGLCEDNLGHYQAAADWYDKFLAHVPDKLASQGDEIRKRNAEIKAMPGKVHIDSTPAGASVTIDDRAQTAPTPLDVDLAPGTHTLKLAAAGHIASTKSVDVGFASTQTVAAELDAEPVVAPAPVAAAVAPPAPTAPEPAPPPPAPPPVEPRSQIPAVVTGCLAAAAAGVGTVFGIIALGDKSDFNKSPTAATADSGDTHALVSDMAFGVALTFGVTSAVLFLTKDEPASGATSKAVRPETRKADKKTAVAFSPTPIVGPHVGGAGFVLRF